MKNNQHGHNVHYVNNNFHLNASYPAYNNNNSSNNNNGNVKTNSNNNNNNNSSYNRPLNQNQFQPKGSTTQTPTTPGIIGYVPTMAKNVNPPHRSMNNTTSHAKHVYSNMNQQQAKQSDQPLHHLTNYQHHTQTTTSPTSTTALQTSYVNSNSGNYASLERKNSYPFNHKQHQQNSQHYNSNHPHSHHHHHHQQQQQQQQHYQHGNNHQHHQHHTHHAYQKQTSLQENSRKSVNTLFSSPSFSNEPLSTQPQTQQQELSNEQVKEQKLKDQEQINSIVDYLHRVDLNSKQSLMVPSSNNESVSSSSNNIETSDCESYENEYPTASMSSINIANTATTTSISSTPPTTSITTTRTSATSNNDLNEVFTNDDDNDDDVHIVDVEDLVDQSPEETQSFDTIKLKDLVNQTDYVNRFKYYSDYVMAVDRLYPNTKWPLHDSWTFWYFKNDSSLSWEDNLNKLIEVAYIEDFWSVVNYVYSPSRITSHGDIIFFKNGIRPMWEDMQNSDGGSWLFQIQAGGQHKKSNEEIFQYWLDTMLSLIGDCFCDNELQKKYDLNGDSDRKNVTSDEHLCEYISGFYASPRAKMHKLALWTRNYKNEKKTRLIGKMWKDVLKLSQNVTITFEAHETKNNKNGSFKIIYKE